MSNINVDDVGRLSRGKSTKGKIGSRNVPHRLTKLEREAFERSKKYGKLKYDQRKHGKALLNIYKLYCQAKDLEENIVYKEY